MEKYETIRFGEDGITGLYSQQGELVTSGDCYHNKIDEFIEGFLFCHDLYFGPCKISRGRAVEISFDEAGDEWPYIDQAPATLQEAEKLVAASKYFNWQ